MESEDLGGIVLTTIPKETRARVDEVWSALDLGFSDTYTRPGENVREDTLRKKITSIEKAVRVILLAEGIDFSLWDNLGQNHPSAEIYVLDLPSPLRASAYLLLGGYYRQAISLQRDWFDMRLLGIHFGLINNNPQSYQNWKLGADAPIGKRLIGTLFARAEFRHSDLQFGLRTNLEVIYRELSKFTHGAGLEKYDLQHDTDNAPRFNSKSVDLWASLLERSSSLVFSCLVVAYGSNVWRQLNKEERSFLQKSVGRFFQIPSATA